MRIEMFWHTIFCLNNTWKFIRCIFFNISTIQDFCLQFNISLLHWKTLPFAFLSIFMIKRARWWRNFLIFIFLLGNISLTWIVIINKNKISEKKSHEFRKREIKISTKLLRAKHKKITVKCIKKYDFFFFFLLSSLMASERNSFTQFSKHFLLFHHQNLSTKIVHDFLNLFNNSYYISHFLT